MKVLILSLFLLNACGVSEAKDKILSRGENTGTFLRIQKGDYIHLEIQTSKNKRISFWCGKDCDDYYIGSSEAFEKKWKSREGKRLRVKWQEVEKFVAEAGEKVRLKETIKIEMFE